MNKTIDYYYTHASPWTYLGTERFYRIAREAGATINFRPVSFAVIFPQSGGLPLPKRAPQRRAYRMTELKRWRAHLGIPIVFEPKYFPVDDTPSARLAIAAQQAGHDIAELSHALLRAVWVEERNIADENTLVAIAEEQGFDGAALLEASKREEIGAIYDAYTEEALTRQVFGAPTYIYRDELFWGQDRLDFLERALAVG